MMLSRLDDGDYGDWAEVFKYAENPINVSPPGIQVNDVSTKSFTREDVRIIVAMVDGENDVDDWLGLFRLRDGRWASIRAGCDYTGWG